MSYFEEFKQLVKQRDLPKLVTLWQEYCANDRVDVEEFCSIMSAIKGTEIAQSFGRFAEEGMKLWEFIEEPEERYQALRLLIDLQVNNSSMLADLAFEALKARYAGDEEFNERIRLVGLRGQGDFRGAISHYELLAHMKPGNFVFHTGGWDTGQIVEVSPVLEQLAVDFEFVTGRKHFNFQTAFNTLVPLRSNHFFARRFDDPDQLEKEARAKPVETIYWILRDLGPMTAAEIKEEMCELVIPEEEWTKWWQALRSKLKKDPLIEAPQSIKEPFLLRKKEMSQGEMLAIAVDQSSSPQELLQKCYSLVRDIPALLREEKSQRLLQEQFHRLLASEEPMEAPVKLQLLLLYESCFNEPMEVGGGVAELLEEMAECTQVIQQIPILALKKRALVAIRERRTDWVALFLSLLFVVEQNPLRDYLLRELNGDESKAQLSDKIGELLQQPLMAPEFFVWYFQKLVSKEGKQLPFGDEKSVCVFFETFLILYNLLELRTESRDLIKKMYQLLSAKRFLLVRQLLEKSTLEFAKEYLLLISKCQTLSDHDVKIMRSLAEVVHRELVVQSKKKKYHALYDGQIIWTSHEGYFKTKKQIETIGTIDIVENARDIERARSLGDLRENSEYKYALEKRAQLQGQLKMLSDQLNRARIISEDDVSSKEVSVGSVVAVVDPHQRHSQFVILGPWDANPEEGILSFQSQLAQSMLGLKVGDTFQFREETWTIVDLSTVFQKQVSG